VVVAATLLTSAVVRAAHVDFKDPRRALGREDNIKVDAEMVQDTISAGAPISIVVQIENLTSSPIAIADKIADATYDPDSQTISMTVGAEIPQETMPHLMIVAPGRSCTFRTAASAKFLVANDRGPFAQLPHSVQITVNVLRDISPFAALIEQQAHSAVPAVLPNDLFDKWVASVASVDLNELPVRWSDKRSSVTAESNRPPGSRF
jgi:hypothetical protein